MLLSRDKRESVLFTLSSFSPSTRERQRIEIWPFLRYYIKGNGFHYRDKKNFGVREMAGERNYGP